MKRQAILACGVGCWLGLAVMGMAAGAGNPLAAAEPYAGKFSDGKVTVELSPAGDGYAGTITVGGVAYPARAKEGAEGLAGTFTSEGNEYTFTGKRAGDVLTVVSGGKTYTLAKQAAEKVVENPLGGGGQSSGEFSVLGSTESGKTLFVKLAGAKTLDAAIAETASDVGKVLDGKVVLTGAFADARTKSKGGALFTGKLKGAVVKGWIFCGVENGAGTATVVYAAADAVRSEAATLFSFMPSKLKLTEHVFPDGSGSVGLPEGWTTEAQSATSGVMVKGPAGQMVTIGITAWVNTPHGQMAQMDQQMYQTALQTYQMQMQAYRQNAPGIKEPQKPREPDPARDMPRQLFCQECSSPEEVLKYFFPATAEQGKRNGTPYTTIDKLIESVPAEANPQIAGDKAGVVYVAVTDHVGKQETHVRALARMETYPVGDGKDAWCVVFNGMRGPEETFERDLPMMNAILTSFKVNTDVVNHQIQHGGAAIRKMGDDAERQLLKRGRDSQAREADNFNRFEAQDQARQQALHDCASDFIEYIGGMRTVQDAKTGLTTQVDMSKVDDFVKGMNEGANDPGRFVPVPLRNER